MTPPLRPCRPDCFFGSTGPSHTRVAFQFSAVVVDLCRRRLKPPMAAMRSVIEYIVADTSQLPRMANLDVAGRKQGKCTSQFLWRAQGGTRIVRQKAEREAGPQE